MIAKETAHLLRLLTSPLLVADPEQRIVHVNQAMCEFLGVPATELMGRPLARFWAGDPDNLKRTMSLFSGSGDWLAGNLPLRRGDGQVMHFPCQGAVVQRPVNGRPALVGINFNSWIEFGTLNRKLAELNDEIRRQRKAEAELHASESIFRQMFECNDAVMLLIEPEVGTIEDANAAASRFYGYSVEQLRGMRTDDIDALSPAEIAVERARAASEECGCLVFPHRLASGEVRTVEVHASPIDVGGNRLLLCIIHDVTGRQRAEAELRQNQQLLHSIIDNTTAVIFVKDLEGRYLLINQRYGELFHVSNETMLGRTDHDLFATEVADAMRAADQRVLSGMAAQEFEEVAPQADGPHTYISLKFPLRDAAGQPYAVCGIATDITERKRHQDEIRQLNQGLEQRVAERTAQLEAANQQFHDLNVELERHVEERTKALAESQARYRTLFDSAPVACVVWEAGYRVVEWNRMAELMFGWQRAEVLGRNFFEFMIPGATAKRVQSVVDDAIKTGIPTHSIDQNLTKQGHLITCEWYNAVVPDPERRASIVMSMCTDITERRRAEEEIRTLNQTLEQRVKERTRELHAKEAQLQETLNAMPIAVFFKDRNGRYLGCNPAFTEVMGVTADEIRGKTVYELWPGDLAHVYHEKDLELVANPEPQQYEFEVLDRHKQVRQVLYAKNAFRDDHNEVAGIIGAFIDITERKEAEKALLQLTEQLRTKEALLRETLSLNANILMTSAVGIAAYRQDGQCVMANPSFAEMIGGTEEQMLSQDFRSLSSWRISGLLGLAESVLTTGLEVEHEIQLTTTFGRRLWLHCQLSRFISEGEPHLLLMFHDVSEERQIKEALLERERNFRTLAENVPDNIIRCDLEGRVLFVNKTLENLLGLAAEEMLGKTGHENFPDGRFAALDLAMQRVGATGESTDFEQIVPGPNGAPGYHLIRIVPEPGPTGLPTSVLAVGHDVTKQRTTEEQLRLAASVFQNSAEGVVVTDASSTIVSVNPAFTEITGYSEAEAVGQKPSLLRSDRHEPEFYRTMWEELAKVGRWKGEIWNRRKGGEAYLEWLTINRIDDDAGKPIRYVSVFHDITEIRRKDERIRHLAFHDALTGLPNRALMQDRLQHALARAQREGGRLSVTFMDLDRFKAINDGLGHDVGDLLLQEVASRIKGRLRAVDTVARMGGDEFVVLMEDLDKAGDCACLAQELIAEISRPMKLRGHDVQVGASMGMAFFPEDGADALELMKHADLAMYAAKSAGRNTYRFFQPEMMEQTSQRLTMEIDLRRAIASNELELHYQPKVDLATVKPLGVEALVRSRHPTRGLLPPSDFIPLAEESGLIVTLGNWVLDEVCRQSAEWQARGLEIKIAINVSAKQLDDGDLVDRVSALTVRHGILPTGLEIELTESAVMANPEGVIGLFGRLRDMGVTVAVDDFGTGYSSLAYLRRLPIDVLKVDSSFVMNADRDEEDAQIVKTIVALGQTLKLTVVAEGIETHRQAELLRAIGCDIAQGYLYSRPLRAQEVEEWLTCRK